MNDVGDQVFKYSGVCDMVDQVKFIFDISISILGLIGMAVLLAMAVMSFIQWFREKKEKQIFEREEIKKDLIDKLSKIEKKWTTTIEQILKDEIQEINKKIDEIYKKVQEANRKRQETSNPESGFGDPDIYRLSGEGRKFKAYIPGEDPERKLRGLEE